MPILVWFYDNWFFEWSTNTSYQRCGSQTTACHKKRNRLFVLSMFEAQNLKKLEIVFHSILFYLRLIHGNHFTHSTVTSFFLIKPEVDIFRVWFLIFSLESRWLRVVKCPYWLDCMIIDFSKHRPARLISAVGEKPPISTENGIDYFFCLCLRLKISKNWKLTFTVIFFICDWVKIPPFWGLNYRLSQNR